MRLSTVKINKPIKISVCLVSVIASIMFLALYCAGQDISRIKQEGTDCTFRARILEKTGDKGHHGLVVKKMPTTDVKEKRILVLVTKATKIGYQVHGSNPRWQDVAYKDLKEEAHVLIQGLQVIEKEGEYEIIVVLATQIEFSE